jgi:hypothetical protein
MNFAVVEIKDDIKHVVDFVESIDLFIYNMKKVYPLANYTNYVLPTDIEKYDYFSNGLYIISENNVVNLLEKSNIIEKGFFYNTLINKVVIKKSWECIPINSSLNDLLIKKTN